MVELNPSVLSLQEILRRTRDATTSVRQEHAESHNVLSLAVVLAGARLPCLQNPAPWQCPEAVLTGAGDVNPDTAIVPADVLSKQALDGQAEDLAMEDTLYALEKAMQAGSLTPDVYIKQVSLPFHLPSM